MNATSKELRTSAPDVRWRLMVDMRNRLIHSYFDIDLDRVWDTVIDDLPPLVAELKGLLQPASSD